jgi:deoxyxylulose-5-phosphate synthase
MNLKVSTRISQELFQQNIDKSLINVVEKELINSLSKKIALHLFTEKDYILSINNNYMQNSIDVEIEAVFPIEKIALIMDLNKHEYL